MIQHRAFQVEPWVLRETELDLERLAQTESLFALSNGHIGLRGNLDEGEPSGLPGTYLAGFYEVRPLPYAEPGYGNPEAGQTVINVTNGKILRLLVEDEPFDVRYGALRRHERVLDLRAGVLRRTLEWVSPTGRSVRVASTRLVSFVQRAMAAILYEVEVLEGKAPVVVQSELRESQREHRGHRTRGIAAAAVRFVAEHGPQRGVLEMRVHVAQSHDADRHILFVGGEDSDNLRPALHGDFQPFRTDLLTAITDSMGFLIFLALASALLL